jgi:hypothetical protein
MAYTTTIWPWARFDASSDPAFEYVQGAGPTEGIAAAGFYPQNNPTADAAAGIERDATGNLLLKDANAGSHTLASLLGTSFLAEGFIDITVAQGQDEVLGVVTGLPSTPVHVLGVTAFERDNGALQSGIDWLFEPGVLTADGFNWKLRAGGEYWPETTPLVVRVSYLWSTA